MSKNEVLAQTIAELEVVGLAMQVAGRADPRTENALSTLVDMMEDSAKGRTIADEVSKMLNGELDSAHFVDAAAVLEFQLSSERFLGALEQIGLVTEKNHIAVNEVTKAVYTRAIQMYAEQYRTQERQKEYPSASATFAPRRYDAEGRLR